jgi:hypothetical protein
LSCLLRRQRRLWAPPQIGRFEATAAATADDITAVSLNTAAAAAADDISAGHHLEFSELTGLGGQAEQ